MAITPFRCSGCGATTPGVMEIVETTGGRSTITKCHECGHTLMGPVQPQKPSTPPESITRVIFDYDNTPLKDVLQDILGLLGYWFDFAKELEVYRTSEGSHHALLKTEPIPFQVGLNLLMASNCSEDYKEFVVHRGFTRRVSAKTAKPAPELVFSVKTGHYYGADKGWLGSKPP